mgnify:FL=1
MPRAGDYQRNQVVWSLDLLLDVKLKAGFSYAGHENIYRGRR